MYINYKEFKSRFCIFLGIIIVFLQCFSYINVQAKSVSDNAISGNNNENTDDSFSPTENVSDNQVNDDKKEDQGNNKEEDKDNNKETDKVNQEIDDNEGDSTVSENSADAVKILFVGNSFSRRAGSGMTSSVPSWLRKVCKKTGKPVFAQSVAHNGAKLKYYTGNNTDYIEYYIDFITKLESRDWDYVVLQEQSLNPIFNYESEFEAAVLSLSQIIKKKAPKAKILLYMTHGYNSQAAGYAKNMSASEMEIRVGAAYQKIGMDTGFAVVPVGMQFYRYSKIDKNSKLIGEDAKHPTPLGYLISACCFYQEIFGDIPEVSEKTLNNWGIDKTKWDLIRELVKGQISTNKSDMLKMTGQEFYMKVNSDTKVEFYSTNPQIAAVNPVTGKIITKKNGTTIIYAQTKDGRQAFLNLQVADDIPFGRSEYVASLQDKIQILPSEWKGSLNWKSSNEKIAVVDQNGYIFPKKAGRVTITAYAQKNKKIKGSFTLFISLPYVKNVKVTMSSVTTRKFSKESVRLTWTKTNGAERYKIYRSKQKNGGYRLIGTVKKTSFVDDKCPVNRNVYYKVLAVNKYKYCRSEKFKVISCNLVRISDLKVKVNGRVKGKKAGIAVISWKKNKSADGYRVYRADSKNGSYKKIADIKDRKITTYQDEKRKKNQSYFYKVVGYNL